MSRATVEYLGGTRIRYTCSEGHRWVEDLGRKSLKTKRLSATAVAMMANWWKSGVTISCPRCTKILDNSKPFE